MTFDEMESAVSDANRTLRLADAASNKLARLLIGRLRKVDGWNVLRDLKRELQDYDAHRRVWRDQK